jgi:hypothetical protein
MAKISVFIGQDDIKQARLYWGAMPLPVGGELIGLVGRTSGELGAAIVINNLIWQGNAGALKSTGCRID